MRPSFGTETVRCAGLAADADLAERHVVLGARLDQAVVGVGDGRDVVGAVGQALEVERLPRAELRVGVAPARRRAPRRSDKEPGEPQSVDRSVFSGFQSASGPRSGRWSRCWRGRTPPSSTPRPWSCPPSAGCTSRSRGSASAGGDGLVVELERRRSAGSRSGCRRRRRSTGRRPSASWPSRRKPSTTKRAVAGVPDRRGEAQEVAVRRDGDAPGRQRPAGWARARRPLPARGRSALRRGDSPALPTGVGTGSLCRHRARRRVRVPRPCARLTRTRIVRLASPPEMWKTFAYVGAIEIVTS